MNSQSLKFLIVEDQGLIAAQLAFIIKSAGHTVVSVAETNTEACELARLHKPDVVLLDIALADGDMGIDIAHYLIEECKSEVVFTTANRRRIPDHYCGAVGVIEKPFTRTGLIAALEFIVARLGNISNAPSKPESLMLSPNYAMRWAS